jgi:hypothetical protein
MPLKFPWRLTSLRRAIIEIAFIVFLFYANLLMGEFTRSSHRSLLEALADIFTFANFAIAIVAAALAYLVFEWLRAEM